MGSCHLPCCIFRVFGGWYQLCCSKGILNTFFSCNEIVFFTNCSPIPLDELLSAPKISLRTVMLWLNAVIAVFPFVLRELSFPPPSEEEKDAPDL